MKNQSNFRFDLFGLKRIFQGKWVIKQSCTNKNTPYKSVFRPKLLPTQNSQNRSQWKSRQFASDRQKILIIDDTVSNFKNNIGIEKVDLVVSIYFLLYLIPWLIIIENPLHKLEPVITMSPEKMTVGSKYSQISNGPIEKLLFLPCYSNRRQNFKNLQGILKFCNSIWHHLFKLKITPLSATIFERSGFFLNLCSSQCCPFVYISIFSCWVTNV